MHCHELGLFVFAKGKGWKKGNNVAVNSQSLEINSNCCYAFKCYSCDKFNNDYVPNFIVFDNNVSIFSDCVEKWRVDSKDDRVCNFMEICNNYLIGTRKEINQYIIKKYKELEKKEKDLESRNSKIQKDFESEKHLKTKLEKELNNLKIKNNKDKIKLEDLNKELTSEKNKNLQLNEKLDNISSENNKNINEILAQLKNEQNSGKNLESKLKELQINEKKEIKIKEELSQTLGKKEKEIEALTNNNNNLIKNVENLKKEIIIKDNEIKKINNLLNNANNTIQNVQQDLKTEQNKNNKLKRTLDNIANDNNKNMKLVLDQLQEQKLLTKDLETKNTELQKKEKENIDKNIELENQLKDISNNINYGLKFQSDCKEGEYDIVLAINSFKSLLKKFGGWPVKYCLKNGKENYLNKKNEPTIILGVIGNGNKGKSFILEKLSGYTIKKGFNVKTEGLSIRYGSSSNHNITILDSAGQETPLLSMTEEEHINNNINNNANNNIQNESQEGEGEDKEKGEANDNNSNNNNNGMDKEKESKKNNNEHIEQPSEGEEFEEYSRDKLSIELFLQKFIINYSNILILVVGNISLTEQKLLERVKDDAFKTDLNNKNKKLFVIHNLKEFTTKEQVEDYIQNTLKKLYNTNIEERTHQSVSDNYKVEQNNLFNRYFVEKDKNENVNVIHLIFVNAFSKEIADYYNLPTLGFIQKSLEVVEERQTFPVIDVCKKFIVSNSDEIIEHDIQENNLVTIEGETEDRIVLENCDKIILKKLFVNEIGFRCNNETDSTKYIHYIVRAESMLYVKIALSGGGRIKPSITSERGFYCFVYEGKQKGDELIEEDKKSGENKLIKFKSKHEIKSANFKVEFKISTSEIQLVFNEGENLQNYHRNKKPEEFKGIYTYKYKILILNQKNEESKDDEYEDI